MQQTISSKETIIKDFQDYFTNNLNGNDDRKLVLKEFQNIIKEVNKQFSQKKIHTDNPIAKRLDFKVSSFLKKHFPINVFNDYNTPKSPPKKIIKRRPITNSNKNMNWENVADRFLDVAETFLTISERKASHKYKFLMFIYDCFENCGLHTLIYERSDEYKTYNLSIEHFIDEHHCSSARIFMPLSVLIREYRKPFSKKFPIKLEGRLINFEDIEYTRVSSSFFNEEEAKLFLLKKGCRKTDLKYQKSTFASFCIEEEDFFPNPYIIEDEKKEFKFRNDSQSIISNERIDELKTIKSSDFDIRKLVRLCEELNSNAINGNWYSVCFLSRAIIDYVPPIFGLNNFNQVASNHGGRSIKKNLKNLQLSLRNIADGHIHAQARK